MRFFSHYMAFLLGSSCTSIAVRLQGSMSTADIGFPLGLAVIAAIGLIFSFGRK